jgi:uncharacterized protein involved in outer membrane biogenesis
MKIYTITGWRKKLTVLVILVIVLIALLLFMGIFLDDNVQETLNDDPSQELQQDVLTQPIRVQALPDMSQGEIDS